MLRVPAAVLGGCLLLSACGSTADEPAVAVAPAQANESAETAATAEPAPSVPAAVDTPAPTDTPAAQDTPDDAVGTEAERPAWLGTRVLPLRADGYGEVQPTPVELTDRRLPPPALLPPPAEDAFSASVEPVPAEIAARSTWSPRCPLSLDELRYVTLMFWGFDGRAHTGELLVHAEAAEALVGVFRSLFDARFPIEEMRVVAADELDAPPTGDGNNTTAFVCRPSRGQAAWSEHAYGLAVDINPFHNPYRKGDVVLPELASAYLDRSWDRAGMIQPGDVVTRAFADIGWGWGGDWRSAKDWMHFSRSGR